MNAHAELIVDSFAGGGGASLGIEWATGRSPDIAINHDPEAIVLHAANHPDSKHYCENIWQVDPVEACEGRPVGLAWFSPDCKHFSKAKGGKPVSKKIRGLAWVVIRWAQAVRPRVIALENVEEFQTWGPLGVDGKPKPERKGETFRAFVRKLRRLGYQVEWRELRACDYGAPTIRKRLFLIARCDGRPIVWPKPTHGKGRPHPWRTAAECIDWSIPCPSIFERSRPLADNTLRRIARGMRRFVVDTDRPFIVGVGGRQGQSPERSVEQPYQTITSKADSAIVVPYLARTAHGEQDAQGRKRGKGEHTLLEPYPTVLATGDLSVVAPHLVSLTHQGSDRVEDLDAPFATITGAHRGEKALAAATLVQTGYGEREGQAPRALDIDRPIGTIVAGGVKHAVVNAFLAKHYGNRGQRPGSSLFEPVSTVTSSDHNALVTSHLLKMRNNQYGQSALEPFPTLTAGGGHVAEVRAFLTAYYGTEDGGDDLFSPARTVTSKDRFALVTIAGIDYVIVDIGMRMLVPRELYRAQGFPDSYRIDVEYNGKPLTKTAQVRMCGNSVCPDLARAIVSANYSSLGVEEVAA